MIKESKDDLFTKERLICPNFVIVPVSVVN